MSISLIICLVMLLLIAVIALRPTSTSKENRNG